MKIKILEPNKDKNEPVMELFLEDVGDEVCVRGKDHTGEIWTIAIIDSRGMRFVGSIPTKTGWPLDSDGSITVLV